MIEIDGSYLEGGGQIVRTALALSTLTGKPFRVKNIRKGRPVPGLKNQHLHAIGALKEICNAKVAGNFLESTEIEYYPQKIEYKNLNIDIGTAGSITLLLQAIIPVVLFSHKKLIIKITGGTDTKHSMPIDYFINVFLPHLRKYADFESEVESRGYYPKGNGRLMLKIEPKFGFDVLPENKPILLTEQGSLAVIKGISHASKDLINANVAERQAKTAKYFLSKFNVPVRIETEYLETLSTGSGITLWAVFSKEDEEASFENPVILGSDSLGKRGKKAEIVGEEAAKSLAKEIESKAAADSHLADQLLPYLAIFRGKIKTSEITEHTKTNIYVIEKFLDVKLTIEDKTIMC